jgi:loricrin
VIGTASCAQLNNNYLPPAGAAAAGGSAASGGGPGLQAPRGPGGPGGFAGANVPFNQPRAGPGQGPAPARPNAPSAPRPNAPAAPSQPSGPPIEIISYENVNNGDGSYKWR